jgi:hypothetical protein
MILRRIGGFSCDEEEWSAEFDVMVDEAQRFRVCISDC